jgi:plastocyanin
LQEPMRFIAKVNQGPVPLSPAKSSRNARRAITSTAVSLIVLILAVAVVSTVYVNESNSNSEQIAGLKTQLAQLSAQQKSLNASLASLGQTLPVMNQRPTQRVVTVEWTKLTSKQDRFFTNYIVVNQGDTADITFISNDTASHTFTIDAPYNFQINGSIPGTIDDSNGKTFTTQPTNNSPGVVVSGTPGNVSARGSFVAKYAGIFEYYCIYHIHIGMFGFLIVLPNEAYASPSTTSTTSSSESIVGVHIDIPQGAGGPNIPNGFVPDAVTLVMGVNNTVTWTNNDSVDHTVTALDGSFNSHNMQPGAAYTFTFPHPGTYSYGCEYHPWMKGTIIVKASP